MVLRVPAVVEEEIAAFRAVVVGAAPDRLRRQRPIRRRELQWLEVGGLDPTVLIGDEAVRLHRLRHRALRRRGVGKPTVERPHLAEEDARAGVIGQLGDDAARQAPCIDFERLFLGGARSDLEDRFGRRRRELAKPLLNATVERRAAPRLGDLARGDALHLASGGDQANLVRVLEDDVADDARPVLELHRVLPEDARSRRDRRGERRQNQGREPQSNVILPHASPPSHWIGA